MKVRVLALNPNASIVVVDFRVNQPVGRALHLENRWNVP